MSPVNSRLGCFRRAGWVLPVVAGWNWIGLIAGGEFPERLAVFRTEFERTKTNPMANPLLAAVEAYDFWYAVPLVVAVSLVYAATRHEELGPILSHAMRIGVWIVGFMLIVLVVLLLVSWFT